MNSQSQLWRKSDPLLTREGSEGLGRHGLTPDGEVRAQTHLACVTLGASPLQLPLHCCVTRALQGPAPEDKDDQIAIKQLIMIMMAAISEPVAWYLVDAEYSVFT